MPVPHILVADDDANMREVVAHMLEDYRVSVAANGPEALTILQHEAVDLLITDYLMPGLTGTELIDAARTHGVTCPVLVLTGYAHLLEQETPTNWRRYPHLAKPIQRSVLLTMVARLLPAR